MKSKFAKKIIALRDELGWSQSDVARKSGCTSATISILEKGERQPSLVMASKIAKGLNVPVSTLTDGEKLVCQEYAHVFYMRFSDIDDLNKSDQKLILSIAKRLKEGKYK